MWQARDVAAVRPARVGARLLRVGVGVRVRVRARVGVRVGVRVRVGVGVRVRVRVDAHDVVVAQVLARLHLDDH